MAPEAIVFALSNPDPEVHPDVAARHAAIVATGRSDFPNQINNVLAFPGVFRGALDAGARRITEAMKLAAADAIFAVAQDDLAPTGSCRARSTRGSRPPCRRRGGGRVDPAADARVTRSQAPDLRFHPDRMDRVDGPCRSRRPFPHTGWCRPNRADLVPIRRRCADGRCDATGLGETTVTELGHRLAGGRSGDLDADLGRSTAVDRAELCGPASSCSVGWPARTPTA